MTVHSCTARQCLPQNVVLGQEQAGSCCWFSLWQCRILLATQSADNADNSLKIYLTS